MGVTSIRQEHIVPGVRRLVELIRYLVRGQVEHLESASGSWVRGDELRRVMSGATIFYEEVYGTLCTIDLHPDGKMTGHMDSKSNDADQGSWRLDGDRFLRRWNRWNYAKEAGYYIVIDGDRIKYFNEDRQVVDSARIAIAATG
jgi:GntR family transcriptional regulator/MocR family aminotransferase